MLVQSPGSPRSVSVLMARPNLSYLKNLALTVTGLLVGILTGLTGMGAALILSPSLIWLLGLRDRPLSLVVLIVTTIASLFALLAYGQMHEISLYLAILFAVSNAVGIRAGAGSRFGRVRDSRGAPFFWSFATLAVAGWLMYSASHGLASRLTDHSQEQWPLPLWAGVAISGFIAGIVGKVGNVGGLLSMPCLLLVAGAQPLAAQATVLTALVLISVLPTASTLARREAPAAPSAWTGFGAALGALTGSRLAVELPSLKLMLTYGAGMYIVGFVRLLATWPRTDTQKQAPDA
jgi:uncharacterized membrane protein YfcA